MSHKSHLSIFLFFFLVATLILFLGCNVSDVNQQTSISSGTTTGSGSSGGAPANITVYAASNSLIGEATTTITVIVTDASGKRTDTSLTLTSSIGGTFNTTGDTSYPVLNGTTIGGVFIADYKAPAISGTDEVTATVSGTNVRGSTIITVISGTSST